MIETPKSSAAEGEMVRREELLRELRDKVYKLPAEGRRHVGMFVERAAVIALLDPRQREKVA
jgi:tRNA(Ile2) C34 agmatinyltransferase TiaS